MIVEQETRTENRAITDRKRHAGILNGVKEGVTPAEKNFVTKTMMTCGTFNVGRQVKGGKQQRREWREIFALKATTKGVTDTSVYYTAVELPVCCSDLIPECNYPDDLFASAAKRYQERMQSTQHDENDVWSRVPICLPSHPCNCPRSCVPQHPNNGDEPISQPNPKHKSNPKPNPPNHPS